MSLFVSPCPRPDRPQGAQLRTAHGSQGQDQGCGWNLQLGTLVWAVRVPCPRLTPGACAGWPVHVPLPRGCAWGWQQVEPALLTAATRQRGLPPPPRPAQHGVSDVWTAPPPVFQCERDMATSALPEDSVGSSRAVGPRPPPLRVEARGGRGACVCLSEDRLRASGPPGHLTGPCVPTSVRFCRPCSGPGALSRFPRRCAPNRNAREPPGSF